MYSSNLKTKAISFRRRGYSLSEIVSIVHISQSTASVWLKSIRLSQAAQSRISERRELGKKHAAEARHKSLQASFTRAQKMANAILGNISFTSEIKQLLLSFLLWTEGGKSASTYVSFINSDPLMIATFLTLLRQTYQIDSQKLRALVHIHEYHDEQETLKYWSRITGMPISQFSKSYRKPHTGIRVRNGYQGSIRIRYYNAYIARELRAVYNSFARQLGT